MALKVDIFHSGPQINVQKKNLLHPIKLNADELYWLRFCLIVVHFPHSYFLSFLKKSFPRKKKTFWEGLNQDLFRIFVQIYIVLESFFGYEKKE